MEQLREKEELKRIAALVFDIDAADSSRSHHIDAACDHVTITIFDAKHDIDSQVSVYNWDKPFLAQLRKLRHDLEQKLALLSNIRQEISA